MAMQRVQLLVVSEDGPRRGAVCAVLDDNGYRAAAVASLSELEASLESAAAVLLDVSARSLATVEAEHALVRAVVDGRCPIVLFGDGANDELADVADGEVGRLHIPWEAGGRTLLGFLRRLFAASTAPPGPPNESGFPTEKPSRVEGAPLRVLVVDDSEMTLDLVQAQLTASGFDVRIAISFAEVGPIVGGFAPDVVVINVKRPDVPVTRLCSAIRSLARGATVLLSSSMHEDTLASLARMAGADGWASKRQGLETFVGQIGAHLATREARSELA